MSRIQGLKKDIRPILQNRRNSDSNLRPASPSPKTGALSRSPVLNERFNKYRSSTSRSNIDIGPPKPAQKLKRTASETKTVYEELTHTQIFTENSNTESGGENSPRFYTEDTKTLVSSKSETDCRVFDSEDEMTQAVIYLGYSKAHNLDPPDTYTHHPVEPITVFSQFSPDSIPKPTENALVINIIPPFKEVLLPKPFEEIGSPIITEYSPIKKPAIHILSQKPILNCSKYPRVPRFKQVNLEDLAKVYQLPELSDSSYVPYSQLTDDRLITTSDLFRTQEEELSQSNSFDYSDSQSSPDNAGSARLLEKTNIIVRGEVLSFSPSRSSTPGRTVYESSCINLVPTDEENTDYLRRSSFLSNVSICTEIENVMSFDEFMSQISPKNAFSKSNLPFKNSTMNKTTVVKGSKLTKQLIKEQTNSQKLDINKIKQDALEKERNQQIRKDAAIKLQALIRGFLCKQKLKKLISIQKERIKQYKLNRITDRIKQSFAIQRIVKACTVILT